MKKLLVSTLMGASLLSCATTFAGDATTEEERAVLIRMSSEVNYLRELSASAKASSDDNARVKFDYSALEADLSEIQRAIEQHAMKPNRSPRKFPLLKKRYAK